MVIWVENMAPDWKHSQDLLYHQNTFPANTIPPTNVVLKTTLVDG